MHGDESTLAAAGAPRAEFVVPRVHRAAVDVVDGLKHHHALRDVRLAEQHSAGFAKIRHQRRITVLDWVSRKRDVPRGGVLALDIDGILDGDGDAV